MKWLVALSFVTAALGQDVNSVQPAAQKLLERPEACVRFAEEVGRSLLLKGRGTEHGLSFADKPDVYSGDAGVALLFVGLVRATGKPAWLDPLQRTLDHAVATRPKSDFGLYTGLAGIGQAALDAWTATKDPLFLDQARVCAKPIVEAKAFGPTDIIFGAAGTGIFVLNLHVATGEKKFLKAARRAGDYLVETRTRKDKTACWAITPGKNPKVYLGFSHGAGGIGYFLLHLGRVTGDKKYTDVAEEAARYVLKHAIPDGEDGYHWDRTVPKDPPDDPRRIQWCHGAPGMGLFFSDLYRFVKKDEYKAALLRCIATTRRHGRTARRSGCQCHGVAGNAELFLEAHAVLKDPALLAEARAFGSALVQPAGGGFKVKPDADPSYMVGFAGIGHYFLRLADSRKHALPLMVRVKESR